MTDVTDALDNLRVHQRQLDADGCEVGVSREALNEVIRAYGAQSLRSAQAGEVEVVAMPGIWEAKYLIPEARVCKEAEVRAVIAAKDAETDDAWKAFGEVPRDKPLSEHITAALAELAKLADDERARANAAENLIAKIADIHERNYMRQNEKLADVGNLCSDFLTALNGAKP